MWTLFGLLLLAFVIVASLPNPPRYKRHQRPKKAPQSLAIGLPRTLDALREKRAHEGEEYEESESLRRQREAQDDVEDVEA